MTDRNRFDCLSTRNRIGGFLAVLLAAFAGSLTMVPSVGAQQDQPITVGGVDLENRPEVSVVVAVPAAASGTALGAERFSVLENGLPVDAAVQPLDGGRLQVALAVDTSGSMDGAAIEAAREAARQFVEALPPGVEISVIGFDTDLVISDFAADREQTLSAIANLRTGGETALHDAMLGAADLFAADTTKIIVVLSDGGDTESVATFDQVLKRLAGDQIAVHAVALSTGESDRTTLEALAAASGRVVQADDPVALSGIYNQLANELASPARLSWQSPNQGTTNIVIRVEHPELGTLSERLTVDYGQTAAAAPVTTPPASTPPAVVPEVDTAPAASSSSSTSSDGWKYWVGLSAFALALLLAGLALFWPHRRKRRLAKEFAVSSSTQGALGRGYDRVVDATNRKLRGGDREHAIQRMLDRAGMNLSAGVAVTRSLAMVAVAVLFGFIFGGLLLALCAALSTVGILWATVSRKARSRQAAFGEQLESTLQMMTGSLRAGFGINQALSTVARESESPTSEEFARVISEVRIGRDLPAALHDVADRVGSEDFDWVAQSLEINRDVGGNLAEVLDNVAGTIRERRRLARHVKALSAEGKLSAMILLILPVGLVLWMSVTNPTYLGELTDSSAGWTMIGAAIVLLFVGILWMRKIIRIRY
jgi:tight adherence protein B